PPSQRYHWYAYESEPTPAHSPVEAVSCTPRAATPATTGGAECDGPARSPPTTAGEAVLSAACVVVPKPASTSATSAWPTSSPATVYVLACAPAISVHTRPFALQRRHEYVRLVGSGLHAPVVTWSGIPSTARPVICGWAVSVGPQVRAAAPAARRPRASAMIPAERAATSPQYDGSRRSPRARSDDTAARGESGAAAPPARGRDTAGRT